MVKEKAMLLLLLLLLFSIAGVAGRIIFSALKLGTWDREMRREIVLNTPKGRQEKQNN
jgi:hypothetical protein